MAAGAASPVLPDNGNGAEGGRELSNADPALANVHRGLSRMIVAYLVAFSVVLILFVIALGTALQVVGVVLLVIAIFAIMLWLTRQSTGASRTYTPDTIKIYPDRLVGTFRSRPGEPVGTRTQTMPFAAVSSLMPAGNSGGREHFWVPAQIRANYARVIKFDPNTVRELLRGPPVPDGCAGKFILATQNFAPVKEAYLRVYPSAPILSDGGVLPHDT